MMLGLLRTQNTVYRLIRPLGHGGFGRVYLAQDHRNRNLVAVKLLDRPFDQDARRRFRREAVILSLQLSNRFVIDLLDYNLESHYPFLVLEYSEKGSLADWATQTHGWPEIAAVLTHVAAGLTIIHGAGGFHRDIKPDNLLVCRVANGEVLIKLSDFGLGRLPNTSSRAFTQTPRGTIGYMAPEVRAGQMHTAAADVYSLGITAIELLTSVKDTDALLSAPIPSDLRLLLQTMVSPLPQHRPSIQAVRRGLEQILSRHTGVSTTELVSGLVIGVGLLAVIGLVAGSTAFSAEPRRA